MGRTAPDPKNSEKIDGVIVPIGPNQATNVSGSHLQYNEYIVYDRSQIKIKYIVRTRFNFKNRGWF